MECNGNYSWRRHFSGLQPKKYNSGRLMKILRNLVYKFVHKRRVISYFALERITLLASSTVGSWMLLTKAIWKQRDRSRSVLFISFPCFHVDFETRQQLSDLVEPAFNPNPLNLISNSLSCLFDKEGKFLKKLWGCVGGIV